MYLLLTKKNFKFSSEINEIEKKIFELRNSNFDIFEKGDDFIIYKIENTYQREPDLNDIHTKNEILELIFQKNKFDYNRKLLEKISQKNFNNNDFLKMGEKRIQTTVLNSIKDNNKFEIDAVKILYSLPENSFTLINDENGNIFLAKIKKIIKQSIIEDSKQYIEYASKENSNIKNTMLKSYDLYLNEKYKVDLNKKTIERVKNFFQ